MKKTIFLLILALLFCGCANDRTVSESDNPDNIRSDKKLSYDCYIDYYWQENENDGKDTAKEDYGKLTSDGYRQSEFITGGYQFSDIVPLGEDAAYENKTIYAKCCEWLAANYSTSYFSSKEKMISGIESRYSFLSSDLKTELEKASYSTKRTEERFEPAVACSCGTGNNGDFGARPYYIKYLRNTEEYKGYIFRFNISFSGKNERFLPQYVTQNRIYAQINPEFTANRFDRYVAVVGFDVEVIVDGNGNICDFREIYKTLDAEKISYWIYDENGATSGCDGFYFPPEPANLTRIGVNTQGPDAKAANAINTGIEFYKALIGLSESSKKFDSLPLSEKLDRKILDDLISDAEKYGVKFELDPSSIKKTDDMRFYDIYNNGNGEVYMIQRTAFMKTGSREFNNKYGLNIDRQRSTANIYICEENGEYKICAVKIFSSSVLETEQALNEFWSGNGNNG